MQDPQKLPWWRLRRISTGFLVTLLASVFASTAVAAAPTEPLGHAGRWVTDARGRVVIIHGVNVVPSGFESPPETPRQAGFGPDDAAFLGRQGFNGVRAGMFYEGVEPEPGIYDADYVAEYEDLQRLLAEERIFTLLDMHQDQYTHRYLGRGLPDWAALDRGLPNPPLGFPGGYLANPALNRAYDSFWANTAVSDGRGLLDHYAKGWRRIARRFADADHLLGYDIFNEPWPGTAWPTCANPAGCPPGGFDQTALTAFSRRIIDAIRTADPRHLSFYEPNLQFDVGAATGHGPVRDRRAGFSFHNYCLGAAPGLPKVPDPLELCEVGEQLVFDNAEAHSRSTGAALLMTEFGDNDDPVVIRRMARLADQNMVGWTYWSYLRSAGGQIIVDPSRSPSARGNLREDVLDVLARAYPRLIAGTPKRFAFDLDSRTFDLEYSTKRVSGNGRFGTGSKTAVFVPARHYPGGYRVKARGAEVVSELGARVLTLASLPGTKRVRVKVIPVSG